MNNGRAVKLYLPSNKQKVRSLLLQSLDWSLTDERETLFMNVGHIKKSYGHNLYK